MNEDFGLGFFIGILGTLFFFVVVGSVVPKTVHVRDVQVSCYEKVKDATPSATFCSDLVDRAIELREEDD